MSSAPGTRWQRRKDARPAEILAAALTCFKERGFTATRLEEVAAKAGVTKGTIYLYYPSKEELFKAVVRGELVPNIERLEAAILDAPIPATVMLEQLCTTWAQHIVSSPISVPSWPGSTSRWPCTVASSSLPLSCAVVSLAVSSDQSMLSTWCTACSGRCSSLCYGSILWGRTMTDSSMSKPSAAPTST